MAEDPLKISYNASKLRVRVQLSAKTCLEHDKVPDDVLKRVKDKFEAEKKSGKISFYRVYTETLNDLWLKVRAELEQGLDRETKIAVTIGVAAPTLKGIEIIKPLDDKTAFSISLNCGQKEMAAWNFEWFRLNIEETLRKLSLTKAANPAQLYSVFVRGQKGERILNHALAVSALQNNEDAKPFSIVGNKVRKEIALIIRHKSVFTDPTAVESILKACADASKKLAEVTGSQLEFMRENLMERINLASQGVERFGINLPCVLLTSYPKVIGSEIKLPPIQQGLAKAEISLPAAKASAPQPASVETKADAASIAPEAAPETVKVLKDYPGKGFLSFKASENLLEANIDGFNPKLYERGDFKVDLEWIKLEAERCGIKGVRDELLRKILPALAKQQDINGFCVAVGSESQGGKTPYLHKTFAKTNADENSNSGVDIRDLQQRKVVQPGELIAEILFRKPPVIGMSVFGKPMPPAEDEAFAVTLGEGAEMREAGKYYATVEGVPNITDSSVMVSQVLVHEGDVNLRTGNLRFDGPAEIRGAIDSGATVEITGNLIVHGTIRGGHVRVGGSLEARSGIVTGEKGRVRVRCDIIADFIENSNIVCGGNIKVNRVLINSNVFCGGSIEAPTPLGIVAGGMVNCKKFIRTGRLGFPKGAITVISSGLDWRTKLAIEIRSKRLERVINQNNEDRNNLRELTRKKIKTKKQNEQIKELQEKLQKSRLVIERMNAHLQKAQGSLTYDTESRIYVHETLFMNCKIEIAGINVPITHDVAEVEIAPKRIKGSHIVPMKTEKKTEEDGSQKKAS